MKSGALQISEERNRQIKEEGFTQTLEVEHPEYYDKVQLLNSAVAYIKRDPNIWPDNWDINMFKLTPNDRVRELVKAGALIAAEIDRLQRISPDEKRNS